MIWFTSDTHYGHKNISSASISKWDSGYREFNSLEDMNLNIIDSINKYVSVNDTLYHLGDWAFGYKNTKLFRDKINCKNVHLIYGNHDNHIKENSNKFKELFSSMNDYLEIKHNNQGYMLSHYPMLVWDKKHIGTIMLHGHTHGTINNLNVDTNRLDVGLDSIKLLINEFRPISIEEITYLLKVNSNKTI